MGFVSPTASVYLIPSLHVNFSIRATSMATSYNNKNNNTNTNHNHIRTRRRIPKNLQSPRRSKLPPDFGTNLFLKSTKNRREVVEKEEEVEDGEEEKNVDEIVWESDEIEAIVSLFQGRIPQKPGKLCRERSLPLPLPYKLRPPGLPALKIRSNNPLKLEHNNHKSPGFLVGIAREIKGLDAREDASVVLDKWARFLRKGSLSMTIRELGHLSLPERALQTFSWAQNHPNLSPDDRILGSTVQVLSRFRALRPPFEVGKFVGLASRGVIESLVEGFVRGGSLNLALELLSAAKEANRVLGTSVYAKVISELAKSPDRLALVSNLLDELGERDDLSLTHQDCASVMKACTKLGRFNAVESLFEWLLQAGQEPSVVMYTMVIHSRWLEKRYRDAAALVWEMEGSDCVFDLPAYRVVIRLFVSMNDIARASRYYARLKDSGFSPTYDVYRDLIRLYMGSGRLAKCKEICREVEMAGFHVDEQTMSQLHQ